MIDIPYDYYEYLKKERDSDEYTETTDKVRENFWIESIFFKISNKWLTIEEQMFIRYYYYLRYN